MLSVVKTTVGTGRARRQEALLRRFNKMVLSDGVLQEARRRRAFISNREKQRQAERRAQRRRQRQAMKLTRGR